MSYTKKQIAEITGIDPRLIHFYISNSAVMARLRDMGEARDRGEGRGKIRWVYTDKTLVEFLIIKELSDFKISVGPIRKIMEQVRILITTKGNSINYFQISHAGEKGFKVQAIGTQEPAQEPESKSYLVINYKRLLEKLG